MPHCLDVGCLVYGVEDPTGDIGNHCFRTIHAEINAIAQAARNGNRIDGADVYVTTPRAFHWPESAGELRREARFLRRSPTRSRTIQELRERSGVELVEVAPAAA
jgi:dCMP deaminase